MCGLRSPLPIAGLSQSVLQFTTKVPLQVGAESRPELPRAGGQLACPRTCGAASDCERSFAAFFLPWGLEEFGKCRFNSRSLL